MCDLNLNNIRLKRPIIMMRDFLDFLGFDIRTTSEGDFFSKKIINDINNVEKPLDVWISKNIKKDRNIYYNIFFKKIFTAVLTKIKKMYLINDNSVFRIGYTPKIHKELKETSSLFTFGKGGNQTKYKRKRNSKIKKHKKNKRTKKNV